MKNTFRNAFTMKLKPGFETEYKIRHEQIWPELTALLSESGIQDYSIFLDEQTGVLFGVQKLSLEFDRSELSSHPLMRKWWNFMADIMETNPDNSPKTNSLKEVFHLD
ncbi:L-rhamnose mutarotase [Flavobacterium johnsoniae]|uniref:L-rhamnose mutarotase n=1 Tax=Flavobacterium johnsoniae TaxID=986 RepID=A0A1J7BNN3_FLAJO|nr:L-rhamnose mutarotase [Flavobacterium johnsoniae]OIV40319.1 L-rhamnose mutarotase [Flavobacterium johnsoniae]